MSESNNEQSSSDARQKNNNDQWLDEQDHFLLKRILKYEMTTQEEVQKGLSIYYQQKKEKKAIRLGGVLVQNGIITQNELELFDTFQDMNKVTEMDRSFAALALKNKLVTLEQIKLAFQKQAEHFKKTKQIIVIGDILQKLGIMTTAYRDAILSRQQRLDIKYKDTSFGAVAIKMGLATCDQIDDALAIQQKLFSITNKLQLLGNILVDNNVLTEAQTRQILSHQKELKHQAEEREKTHSEKQKKKQKKSGNTQKNNI
jgi:site-specific DNA-adenine methylase